MNDKELWRLFTLKCVSYEAWCAAYPIFMLVSKGVPIGAELREWLIRRCVTNYERSNSKSASA